MASNSNKSIDNRDIGLEVGDALTAKRANWQFKGNVVKHFDEHVSRSVPYYEEGHSLIAKISDFFLYEDSLCYDLGCSTGALLRLLASFHSHKPSIRFVGIDSSEDMIEYAREKTKGEGFSNIEYQQDNLCLYNYEPADLIISYYTLQFVRPSEKQAVVDKLYSSLKWGGALLLFEKVRACDARFQDIMTTLYTDYKLSQGYSGNELVAKTLSLKGVLEPFSTQGNWDMLKRAGFVDIMSVFKYVCFEGFLAIK